MEDASSNSTSSRNGAAVITAPPTRSLDMGETCGYLHADVRGCRLPRSCASCLEMTGCMIGATGACISPSRDDPYEPRLEYHAAIRAGLVVENAAQATTSNMSASQTWQFPAGNVRYCLANDTKCSACTRANFWRSSATFPDSRFCVGDDGECVCIDVCERRWYVQDDCVIDSPMSSSSSSDLVERVWQCGLSIGIFIIAVLVIWMYQQRIAERFERQRRAERERQYHAMHEHARSRELGVAVLTLSGWAAHRREVLEKALSRENGNEGESRTAEEESDSSSCVNCEETRSPRPSAVYVSMNDSEISDSSTLRIHEPTDVTYNEPMPLPQSLAPLATLNARTNDL